MPRTVKQAERENQAAAEAADVVTVRITKLGAGKVATGEHVAADGDILFEAGEETSLPRVVALELEERGYAEIQEPKA
jgi:hypothetical protein